jgi:hypothetical protein
MKNIQKVVSLNNQMMMIAMEIESTVKIMNEIPAQGQRNGATQHVISEMIQNAKECITRLIKQHRDLARESAECMRAFEIRDAKPIDFTTKVPVFGHTEHNSEMASDVQVHSMNC